MVFRWAVWGDVAPLLDLLRHSVGTFHRWFGSDARYFVFTDKPRVVRQMLGQRVEVKSMHNTPFNVNARAPWKKWGPLVRAFPGDVEVHVDIDVFAIGEPYELRQFAQHSGTGFLAMRESRSESLYGLFSALVPSTVPPINTGLIGQRPDGDLTTGLLHNFAWWREQVQDNLGDFHDEQGAVAAVLAPSFQSGCVDILPPHRYRIISPWSNSRLTDLSGVAVIHATGPRHLAFERFRDAIIANSDYA